MSSIDQNHLLGIADLPNFPQINPEHIEPALDELLKVSRELTESLLKNNDQYTWDNLIEPLEQADNQLERMW